MPAALLCEGARAAVRAVAQKAVIREIGAAGGQGASAKYYFSRAVLCTWGGLSGRPSNILFQPPRRDALCSRIRLTACALGICHPRFLCSGAKQTRTTPVGPVFSLPSAYRLPRDRCRCAVARSRSLLQRFSCPFFFPSTDPRPPSRRLVFMYAGLNQKFSFFSFFFFLTRGFEATGLSRPQCAPAPTKFCPPPPPPPSYRQDSASLCASLYGAEVHTVSYMVNYFSAP